MTSLLNFMKMYQLVQTLLVEDAQGVKRTDGQNTEEDNFMGYSAV
jgi:hypothetical protein